MTTQALFYEQVIPLSSTRHAGWCVELGANYDFARRVNAVPLTTVEMVPALREYTIVFAGAEVPAPMVLLGVEKEQNVYVAEDGSWNAKYIPAFVRRYPFVFSSRDQNTFTLCIDESWSGCNQEGRGERLFDEEGKGTAYVENVLGFQKEFQRQSQLTQAFCRKLTELDLLDSNRVDFTIGEQKRSLGGFMAVNRDKLKALPPETLAELMQSGALELIYTHLLSMSNLSPMLERVVKMQ
jgi:hypothetical protein